MTAELKPIRTNADYDRALAEVARLWGAKSGTSRGDRLDVLAALIDAYEAKHYPMDPPIQSKPSNSAWRAGPDAQGSGTADRLAGLPGARATT